MVQKLQKSRGGRIQYVAMKKFVTFALAACIGAALIPAAACTQKTDRTSYDITCSYSPEERTLTARCEVNYYNGGAPTDCVKFNLYGNAYRQNALYKPVSGELSGRAYYAGMSYGSMTVENVEGGTFEVCGEDENILEVTLPQTLESGESAEIVINYTLTLAEVNHRTGVAEHAVNLGNFYPIACARDEEGQFEECVYYSDGDPFVSDCADYMVEITLPEGYEAATSGELVSSSSSTFTYSLECARDFCIVLSDEFETLTREVNGTQITYYYYDDNAAQSKLDAAAQSFEYFCGAFGEYTYPTLAVVQTGFAAGGMEYPALTMINGELTADEAIYAIVHENAHQWWYAMVGSDQINCAWQDEGLAEYSTLMFLENHPDYGYTRTGLVNSATSAYRAYYTVYNQIFGDADTTMNRHLKDFVSDYEYVNIAYNKGLILFDTLRTSIGDERFLAGLKDYFEKYKTARATYSDLIECFRSTGVDVDGFFESFLEGKIII